MARFILLMFWFSYMSLLVRTVFAIQLYYLDAGLCVTATCITQNLAISYSPNLLVELGTVRYIVILSAFHSIPAECSAALLLLYCVFVLQSVLSTIEEPYP